MLQTRSVSDQATKKSQRQKTIKKSFHLISVCFIPFLSLTFLSFTIQKQIGDWPVKKAIELVLGLGIYWIFGRKCKLKQKKQMKS